MNRYTIPLFVVTAYLIPTAVLAQPTGAFESHAPEVQVHLRAPEPGIQFHLYGGSDVATGQAGRTVVTLVTHHFERLCAPPCTGSLRAGTYRFALSLGDAFPAVADPVTIDRPSVITGRYTDRSGWRTAGWIALAVGIVAGGALMYVGLKELSDGSEPNIAPAYVGGGLMGAGFLTWFVTRFVGDGADIDVTPAPAGA